MNKYLKLKFKDACIFPKPMEIDGDKFAYKFKSKDLSITCGENSIRTNRIDIPFYKEYLSTAQISNIIHVLFNERPVPKNRKVIYEKINRFTTMAENSYLKYDIEDRNMLIETIQTKKSTHNSYNPNVHVYWLLLKKYLGVELYDDFISILKCIDIDITKNLEDILYDIRFKINKFDDFKNKFDDFKSKLSLDKKTKMINYIYGDKYGVYLNQFCESYETRMCVNNAISKVLKLSGEIIIPIDNNDENILRNSKGCATVLDGGLLYIDKIILGRDFSERLFLNNGFKKVKDISLQTY